VGLGGYQKSREKQETKPSGKSPSPRAEAENRDSQAAQTRESGGP